MRPLFRKLLILCIPITFINSLYAQFAPVIDIKTKVVGKIFKTNQDIVEKEFIFPERIHHTYIDSNSTYVSILLRGTHNKGRVLKNLGQYIVFDTEKGYTKWWKKVNFLISSIDRTGNTIIESTENKSFLLNLENGQNEWEIKNNIYFYSRTHNIILGYKYKSFAGATNILEGIALNSGKPIWNRNISREYAWNELLPLNDSQLLVAASGLHLINIYTGTGWDYNAITGIKDHDMQYAANAIGLIAGIFTGVFIMGSGPDIVRDLVSNILPEGDGIYFASRDKISKLNVKGEELWSTLLSKEKVSSSSIFINDSILYMLNKGFAHMNNRKIVFGKPFLAAFNLATGKEIFTKEINGNTREINQYKVDNKRLYIIYNTKVQTYSIPTGALLAEKSFDTSVTGKIYTSASARFYLKNDKGFSQLVNSDTTAHYFYTSKETVLVTDKNLNIIQTIPSEQLYTYFENISHLKFLNKDKETFVLNEKNECIASFEGSGYARIAGNKLYDTYDEVLKSIDLSDLMKGENEK